jgi:arylsulfatase A-like enzyme
LYLAYNVPHTPIQPPEEWVEKVKRREQAITDRRAKFAALIEHMDDGIGRVIEALKETGLSDNTLVVFTSDNGGQLDVGGTNGLLRAGKGDMCEGGIRVPMCAVWPGRIEPGSRTGLVAMTMDLFPTVCEAANWLICYAKRGNSLRTLNPGTFEKCGSVLTTVAPACCAQTAITRSLSGSTVPCRSSFHPSSHTSCQVRGSVGRSCIKSKSACTLAFCAGCTTPRITSARMMPQQAAD